MKYGSRTKHPNKEDDIMKTSVVIDRCNDKETHDTNCGIFSLYQAARKKLRLMNLNLINLIGTQQRVS